MHVVLHRAEGTYHSKLDVGHVQEEGHETACSESPKADVNVERELVVFHVSIAQRTGKLGNMLETEVTHNLRYLLPLSHA